MKRYFTLALLSLPFTAVASQPNIVFIYSDDMGWTGSSVEMMENNPATKSDYYQTPNLERLAAKGMVFSQAYSPGPMCTPSRAGVLTGLTPAQLHLTTPGSGRTKESKKLLTPSPRQSLPKDVPTIGSVLKQQGYATALLGKWHIGRSSHAGMYGFDLHDSSTQNDAKGTSRDPKEIFSLTQRGIEFIEQSVAAQSPFFLQISHYAVHSPIQSRPSSMDKFESLTAGRVHQQADYAAMTWDLDASLDLLYESLERLEITDKTYIVYMSDNGAAANQRKPNNSPLYAGKGSLYEGGIRVPLIISGPGVKVGYSAESVSGTDLLATFSSWAGARVDLSESEDLTPILEGRTQDFQRRHDLLFHYPHYGRGRLQVPQSALVAGQWKLLKDWEKGSYQLFNLDEDLGEKNDLAKQETERLESMIEAMETRLTMTEAQLPTENTAHSSGSNHTRTNRPRR
ncbi:sulfatase [Vibrio sp. WXL210]|uniref:sulfatase n=1 Tax=Vibrio sp. WXL210 TaxID=3450709 RepID=UPI003EC5CC03